MASGFLLGWNLEVSVQPKLRGRVLWAGFCNGHLLFLKPIKAGALESISVVAVESFAVNRRAA